MFLKSLREMLSETMRIDSCVIKYQYKTFISAFKYAFLENKCVDMYSLNQPETQIGTTYIVMSQYRQLVSGKMKPSV